MAAALAARQGADTQFYGSRLLLRVDHTGAVHLHACVQPVARIGATGPNGLCNDEVAGHSTARDHRLPRVVHGADPDDQRAADVSREMVALEVSGRCRSVAVRAAPAVAGTGGVAAMVFPPVAGRRDEAAQDDGRSRAAA